jgi:LacI family transcriptional regulator
LSKAFSEHGSFNGIFVPNSRVFKVAEFLEKNNKTNIVTSGYDLVDKNIQYLKQDLISFLISQKPEEQAYNAIMALFDSLITKKEVKKTTFSPIDIIIKENIDYYNEK